MTGDECCCLGCRSDRGPSWVGKMGDETVDRMLVKRRKRRR